MNDYFQENKRSLFILVSLLFVLAIVLYFFLLHPLLGDLSKQEKNNQSIEKEIELLQAQIDNIDVDHTELDLEQLALEKKIPKKRDLDEYILSLQQLEFITHSEIEQIQFVYDSNLEAIEDEEEQTADEAEDDDETEDLGDEVDSEQEDLTIDAEILEEKPESLHVMTVRLTASSPSYDDFINLLETIEEHERVSIVTNLNFTQPTETDEYFTDDFTETITFNAELTTFYYVD